MLHVTAGDKRLPSMAAWIDKELGGELNKALKRKNFSGQAGSSALIHTAQGAVIAVGVGKRPVDTDRIRKAAAAAVGQARAHHFTTLATPLTAGKRLGADAVARAIAEGAILADYRFHKYKQDKPHPDIQLYLTQAKGKAAQAAKQGIKLGTTQAEAQVLARDLANEPPSHLTPKRLAAEARAVARKNGLGVSVLGPTEITRAGLGALLAVARGSDEPPQLIKLTYRPRKVGTAKQKHVVLVGKSITYDSGGLNLKPSRGGALEDMKLDMSGGAAVLGAMSALKKLGVRHKVTGYLPATENLVGGSAYKPGDVVTTYNGKTIEVGNTDAEGRLTLADTLAYAVDKDKPDEIIDLATLTATEISLGPSYAAIFANRPRLEERFKEAGERTGEKVWPLPFPEEYDEMTKSAVADFSNIVSGRAYTLSGPLLLKHFVGKTPWVHLDIGSAAMAAKDSGYTKKGGSGWGTRLLLEYLSS